MSLPVRLGLFYSAIFVGTGAASPYMPVWFAHHGLSGAQIGLILSLPLLARAFTAPLLAVWADSFKLRRQQSTAYPEGSDRWVLPQRGTSAARRRRLPYCQEQHDGPPAPFGRPT